MHAVTKPSLLRSTLLLAAALAGGGLVFPSPALADLRVCNDTPNPISIAMGYRATSGWQSEGWWVATPDTCATLYQGALNGRYYYLYAVDDIAGGAWDGSVYMCTQDSSFTIFGVEDCLARGYERTGFFELDTNDKPDWTLHLTETNATGFETQ